jgi:invasion protein IalB
MEERLALLDSRISLVEGRSQVSARTVSPAAQQPLPGLSASLVPEATGVSAVSPASTTLEASAEWKKTCTQAEGVEICQTGRQLADASGSVVLHFILVEGGGDREVQIAVPSPIMIVPGISIGVDSSPAISAPVAICIPHQCVAGAKADDNFLGSLKSGSAVKVSFAGMRGSDVNLDLPLAGFAEAYEGAGETIDTASQR